MSRLKHAIMDSAVDAMEMEGPGTARKRYCFPQDFLGFSGHFPGYPILPALVQVMTALSLAEELMGRPLRLSGIRNAKFHMEIRPGQQIDVQCRERQMGGSPGCEARLSVAEGLAASFSMVFWKEADHP